MIGFHPVVGVGLRTVPRTRSQFINNVRVHRRLVSGDLHRDDFGGGPRTGEKNTEPHQHLAGRARAKPGIVFSSRAASLLRVITCLEGLMRTNVGVAELERRLVDAAGTGTIVGLCTGQPISNALAWDTNRVVQAELMAGLLTGNGSAR